MASSEKTYTLLFLFLFWVIYLTVGIFIFRAVEHDGDREPEKTKQELLERIRGNITAKYNMSESEFDSIVQQIEAASSSNTGPEWSYMESLSFVIQLVTTIGYGNITPVTTGGRVLCIIYAFFGIPINILLLQLIGQRMLRGERDLVTKFETRCLKREPGVPKYLNEKCTLLGFLLLMTLLVTSAAVHMDIENWTFFEGFYAYFITFTTVGFGDLIPGAGGTKAAGHAVIRIVFIISGLVAMSNMINALVSCSDAGELLRRLKSRCGRERSVEIEMDETKVNGSVELNESIKYFQSKLP